MDDQTRDNLERRCPRLGSDIPFRYCMLSGEDDFPCGKILDCWWETFDVETYLKANLPESLFKGLVSPRPRDKVASLLKIVEQTKKRIGQ